MADYRCSGKSSGYRSEEVATDGAEKIWQRLAEYIESMK